ncbi:MAG: hypothetical protein WCJ19_00955 [bacterium]
MSFLQIVVLSFYILLLLLLTIFITSQFWIDISNMKLKSKFGLPYVPTSRRRLRKIMEFAEVKPGDQVIDLGSGDGRMVIAAARAGAYAVGYELNPVLVWWSRIKIKCLGLSKNAVILRKDLFKADFSKYNVYLLYTMPWVMDKIQNRLNESKYDTIRVVSNTFQFGDIEPLKSATKEKVYLYEIKKS